MLQAGKDHETTRAGFRWQVPERYNIATDCLRWAKTDPDRIALVDCSEDGARVEVTYADLARQVRLLAARLSDAGVGRGDRVAILLPQRTETAVAHLAAFSLGAISLPLFVLFGPDALAYRLSDSGAAALITDPDGAARVAPLRADLPELSSIHVVGRDLDRALAGMTEGRPPVDTSAEDPALLIYTSGTTGPPKGALHAHRVLLGHLPGVEMSHDFLPRPGDRLWTPADWAWIGGLLDVLLPGLHHGLPVVACRFARFTAEAAARLMRDEGVRNVFLPPTALKMMRAAPDATWQGLGLRSIASGGEPLGPELLDWGRRVLGVEINEFYGQTECNMVISSCAALDPAVPGAMGRAVPGHAVAILDPATGLACADGVEGEVAVAAPDPVMFLGYWRNPAATAAKFVDGPGGRWLLTGDRGRRGADGWLRFVGRADDVITSAGYRIGPAEVEDCLLGHPAVRMAGVVGWPDEVRGHVVAAFVQLADGHSPSDALADEIVAQVRTRLAAHEAPRVVRFLDALPQTTTGKIIRGQLRALAEAETKAEAAAASL